MNVRALAIGLGLLLSGSALAERELYIPTARKLSTGTIQYEFRFDPRNSRDNEQYLGLGLSPFWEVEFHDNRPGSGSPAGSFDLTYNLITPITDLSPGFAFGIQDVTNSSETGTRAFAVTTVRSALDAIGGEAPCDLTFGFTFGRGRLRFVLGASIPFSPEFRLVIDHDGDRLSTALEANVLRPLTLSLIERDHQLLMGIAIRHRF